MSAPRAKSPAIGALDALRASLEQVILPKFLATRRWFAGKARALGAIRVVDETLRDELAGGLVLALVEATYQDGGIDTYFVPLSMVPNDAKRSRDRDPETVDIGPAGGELAIRDALTDRDACAVLLNAIEDGRSIAMRLGRIRAFTTSAFAEVRGPIGEPPQVILGKAEQSNSSVLFGDRLILKVFRRVEEGLNPDFEIGRFLSERTSFTRVPLTAGAIEYHRTGREPATLAILQGLVANEGTGWEHALHDLRIYLKRAPRHPSPAPVDSSGRSLLALARDAIPVAARQAIGEYLDAAALLGRRTGELHLALACDRSDPDFAPERSSVADRSCFRLEIREQATTTLSLLRQRIDRIPPSIRKAALRVIDGVPSLVERFEGLAPEHDAMKIRLHGDYHLGQVLRTASDFVILDFEGEPARPLAERRRKASPIKDVVGMLRSFDYAAFAALLETTADDRESCDQLSPWSRAWQTWNSVAFLKTYFATVGEAALLPAEPDHIAHLFLGFMLEKALYELRYELNNRPDWVRIPLRGILALIEEGRGAPAAQDAARAAAGARACHSVSPELTDFDLHLFAEGTHSRAYQKLGAHVFERDGCAGTQFAVWAPHARAVSVIGDFNDWAPAAHPMSSRGQSGIWERFIPGVGSGSLYKYAIVSERDDYEVAKADPYGFAAQTRPQTASKVWDLTAYEWGDRAWMNARGRHSALDAPISIYEVHLGSWMRVPEQENRWLTYAELAARLADHVQEMGFTHVELLPMSEHPFDGSWGYQTVGYFAPTSRFGTPTDFMRFIDALHRRDIGVILDWVPAHFPRDEHGLGYFDGTHLYEHADPRRGRHRDWDTFIFNYGRPQVASFLVSNAVFWLDQYHIDGLRVDAVASMLYLDYSRSEGDWIPNERGGRENLEAIALLRRFNDCVHAEYPGVVTIAEESTAWPMVSRPTAVGGLGFDFKWDLGWMHDTLAYMAVDPIARKSYHDRLTFRGLYAFTENFVLPLSHDEVVYGKGSLLRKMPGDTWQRFASLRLLLGWMFAQPGKKLLFMGGEFGQWREWNHDTSLDWHLLREPLHQGLNRWVRDLNTLYRGEPALHELDNQPAGFAWVACDDAEQSVVSLLRNGNDASVPILVVANFTPVPRHNYRVGVPKGGLWEEILNGDATLYGGSGQGNIGGVRTAPVSWHGNPQSLNLTLPPLAIIVFRWRG